MDTPTKTPWHLWAVGLGGLLWNAFGALDYVMTQSRNEAYLAGFSDEARAYFDGFPLWADSAWAIAIWTSVIGSIFILMRKAWAVPVFLVSAFAFLVAALYNYGLSEAPAELRTPGVAIFSFVIFIAIVAQGWYARRMTAAGILR